MDLCRSIDDPMNPILDQTTGVTISLELLTKAASFGTTIFLWETDSISSTE